MLVLQRENSPDNIYHHLVGRNHHRQCYQPNGDIWLDSSIPLDLINHDKLHNSQTLTLPLETGNPGECKKVVVSVSPAFCGHGQFYTFLAKMIAMRLDEVRTERWQV